MRNIPGTGNNRNKLSVVRKGHVWLKGKDLVVRAEMKKARPG